MLFQKKDMTFVGRNSVSPYKLTYQCFLEAAYQFFSFIATKISYFSFEFSSVISGQDFAIR